ncbi:MAG TPA: GNAT family acetyltransferase [Anaerolineae bacterium]|nr:GNAT family acetyltransferase [Anaerolineae bacterium]
MNTLHIREFQEEDAAAVVALWQACGLVKPWNDAYKDIQRKLTVGRELFLVGEIDGRIAATIMGGYEGHRGWVNYLAVHPDYRRQGYGRFLMDTVESKLLALGCPKINLQIRESNLDVIRFYEAIGYKQDKVVSFGKRLIPDN